MIENVTGGPLRTWRSPVWPLLNETRLTPLGDHRHEYLTFEGEISANRGFVRRVASGTCEFLQHGELIQLLRLFEPAIEDWLIARMPDGSEVVFSNKKSA